MRAPTFLEFQFGTFGVLVGLYCCSGNLQFSHVVGFMLMGFMGAIGLIMWLLSKT